MLVATYRPYLELRTPSFRLDVLHFGQFLPGYLLYRRVCGELRVTYWLIGGIPISKEQEIPESLVKEQKAILPTSIGQAEFLSWQFTICDGRKHYVIIVNSFVVPQKISKFKKQVAPLLSCKI